MTHLPTIGVLHHKAQAVMGLEGILQRLRGRKAAWALLTLPRRSPPWPGCANPAARVQTSASPFGVCEWACGSPGWERATALSMLSSACH